MIYFILCTGSGMIKIGTSGRLVERRRDGLQIGNPCRLEIIATIEGGHREEKRLHRHFRSLRLRPDEEWFYPGIRLMAYIAESADVTAAVPACPPDAPAPETTTFLASADPLSPSDVALQLANERLAMARLDRAIQNRSLHHKDACRADRLDALTSLKRGLDGIAASLPFDDQSRDVIRSTQRELFDRYATGSSGTPEFDEAERAVFATYGYLHGVRFEHSLIEFLREWPTLSQARRDQVLSFLAGA